MGLDAEFVIPPVEGDAMHALEAAMHEAFPDEQEYLDGIYWPTLGAVRKGEPATMVVTMYHYYGEGYPFGFWPQIRKLGDWLMMWFGETGVVRYVDDCQDSEWMGRGVAWPEARATLDALWRAAHPDWTPE